MPSSEPPLASSAASVVAAAPGLLLEAPAHRCGRPHAGAESWRCHSLRPFPATADLKCEAFKASTQEIQHRVQRVLSTRVSGDSADSSLSGANVPVGIFILAAAVYSLTTGSCS